MVFGDRIAGGAGLTGGGEGWGAGGAVFVAAVGTGEVLGEVIIFEEDGVGTGGIDQVFFEIRVKDATWNVDGGGGMHHFGEAGPRRARGLEGISFIDVDLKSDAGGRGDVGAGEVVVEVEFGGHLEVAVFVVEGEELAVEGVGGDGVDGQVRVGGEFEEGFLSEGDEAFVEVGHGGHGSYYLRVGERAGR